MDVDIEILGHKGKITQVSSQEANPPWYKEDRLVVWISFDEPVDSTISFATTIPVVDYSKAGFLEVVKEAGEKDLARIVETNKKEREESRARSQRREKLDHLAKDVEAMFEG